ncbi:hypothetical protein HDU93_010025, partial [Gonapodya sp. JEL0774]
MAYVTTVVTVSVSVYGGNAVATGAGNTGGTSVGLQASAAVPTSANAAAPSGTASLGVSSLGLNNDSGSSSNIAVIAGAVGGAAAVAILGLIVFVVVYRKRRGTPPGTDGTSNFQSASGYSKMGSLQDRSGSATPFSGTVGSSAMSTGSSSGTIVPTSSLQSSMALTAANGLENSGMLIADQQWVHILKPAVSQWFFVRTAALARQSPDTQEAPYSGAPVMAVNPYETRAEDEISIFPGNIIQLSSVYYDGWGVGTNLSTGAYGVFPIDVLPLSDIAPSSVPSGLLSQP